MEVKSIRLRKCFLMLAGYVVLLLTTFERGLRSMRRVDCMLDHFPYRLLLIAITACLVRAPTPTVLAQRPDQDKSQSVSMKRVPVFKSNGLDQVARGKKPPPPPPPQELSPPAAISVSAATGRQIETFDFNQPQLAIT